MQRHVRQVSMAPDHVHYDVAHPCGFRGGLEVNRKVHQSTVKYLRQVADGMRDTGPPVSEDERIMADFHAQLETIRTSEDIERAFNRGPGFG